MVDEYRLEFADVVAITLERGAIEERGLILGSFWDANLLPQMIGNS